MLDKRETLVGDAFAVEKGEREEDVFGPLGNGGLGPAQIEALERLAVAEVVKVFDNVKRFAIKVVEAVQRVQIHVPQRHGDAQLAQIATISHCLRREITQVSTEERRIN
jgi:hypothetical protein